MAISTAVDASAVARVVGIKTEFFNTNVGGVIFLPQRVAVVGQGATASTYPTTKFRATTAAQVGQAVGFGSPLHLAALQLLPANGDGVGSIPVTFYPLVDDSAGVAAAGDITPTGTATKAGTFRVRVSGVRSAQFTVAVGDAPAAVIAKTVSAMSGVLEMPAVAANGTTKVSVTAKWKGASGNDLFIEVIGPSDTGVTFAVTQPNGGAANPDVQPALDNVGNVWETMVLNCLNIGDTDALDAYQTFGDGRWGALVRKPLVVFTGTAAQSPATATALGDSRKTDKVNVQMPNPGSVNLPFVSAAGQLARIVKVANNNPARDYGRQVANYILPGADGLQWTYPQRDEAVKGGCSTVEVRDGEVNISDVVTMYHPTGEEPPAYRFVCDIVKLQNIIFNVDLQFNNAEWDGAPLIPDDQPTVNPEAKKPKNARAVLGALADNLGLNALISDPAYTKANTQSEIDSQNPKRLNTVFPVKLSGNANIHSIDLNFGFYFGTSTIIA
jgi:phage tail sheath gpL-like